MRLRVSRVSTRVRVRVRFMVSVRGNVQGEMSDTQKIWWDLYVWFLGYASGQTNTLITIIRRPDGGEVTASR